MPGRGPPRHHFVDDGGQGVDVRPQIHIRAVFALLGRHIGWAAHDEPGFRAERLCRASTALHFCDAEIQDLHAFAIRGVRIGHEEQVFGLEIAVHDTDGVGSGQGRASLAGYLKCLGNGKPADLLEAFLQGGPFEKLHEDVRKSLGCFASVEDIDDAGMADGARGTRFIEKSSDQFRVLRQQRAQDLDGRVAFEVRVLGKVDLPESALAIKRTTR